MADTFDMAALIYELERDEDRRRDPYMDSGKINIGVGRNLTDNGLRDDEINLLRDNDIASACADLDRHLVWWRTLDPVRQRVFINMCFNMGWYRFSKFVLFFQAVQQHRWPDAVYQMGNSHWAGQVGDRALRLQGMMRSGQVALSQSDIQQRRLNMAVTLPSTPLAAQADLAALAGRVAALEKLVPPQPVKPSATGTYITTPAGTPIRDDALNAWSLVASGGQQIAVLKAGQTPPAVLDGVTANVTKLGIDLVATKRAIVQQNAAGNWYTTSAPGAAWSQIAGPDGPPVPAGSVFKVSGGNIHKPDGTLFKGTGIDLWWASMSTTTPPVGWNQVNQVIANWTTGDPLLTAFPNLSAIRVACFMNDFPTVAQLKPLVDFCTAHRIVLIIDAHDYSGGSNWVYSWADGSLQKAVDFFTAHAKAWNGNPWVWFQTGNEPGTPNEDQFNALYDAVRNAGNETIVVLDWVTWGFTNRTVQTIANRMHNVVIDLHYYASAVNSSMNLQDHLNWIASTTQSINAAYKSADGEIPIICLEFGDACCGAVEPGGMIACAAVPQSAFKTWTIWNWTTDWNHSWGVDVINNGATAVNGGAVVAPYMVKG